MNPSDLLFQAFSNLTGGVITDLTTAMVAMVCFTVLLFGWRKLLSVFEGQMLDRALYTAYSLKDSGGMQGDFYSAQYKALMNKKVHTSSAPPVFSASPEESDHAEYLMLGESPSHSAAVEVPYYDHVSSSVIAAEPTVHEAAPAESYDLYELWKGNA